MAKRQIILELTDLRHHATEIRPPKNIKGALDKGLLPDDPASGRLQVIGFEKDGTPIVLIPPDMQAAIDRGELEVIIETPKGGLPQTLSKDALEKLDSFERTKQKRSRHIARVHEKGEK